MTPQSQPPVSTKAPPTDRKFPCPQCGAKLTFDPSGHALQCPYCGHAEKIEPASQQVQERNFEESLHRQAGPETTIEGRSSQVRCTGCGAVLLLQDQVVTDACPYCGTHLENQPETAQAMIAPEGILPFGIPERHAVAAFNQWVGSRWFAPNNFYQFANLGRLNGLYVPFWTYDSMTYSDYTGQRGDDHTETQTYTQTNADGQVETKTRQVTVTHWTYVSGRVQHFFDDVLVCASKSIADGEAATLGPWELKTLQDFRAEYLSGFKTERYAVGLAEGFDKARAVMDWEIRRLCAQDIGGNHQRLESVHTQHVGVTFKHLLLPVWMGTYRYQNQPYRILVNARTGRVTGTRPYSWVKITLFVLAIALAVLAAVLVFSAVARGDEPGRSQRSGPPARRQVAVISPAPRLFAPEFVAPIPACGVDILPTLAARLGHGPRPPTGCSSAAPSPARQPAPPARPAARRRRPAARPEWVVGPSARRRPSW